MKNPCPCCERGSFDDETRQCGRCGVFIPRANSALLPYRAWRGGSRGDEITSTQDYVMTKADKQ